MLIQKNVMNVVQLITAVLMCTRRSLTGSKKRYQLSADLFLGSEEMFVVMSWSLDFEDDFDDVMNESMPPVDIRLMLERLGLLGDGALGLKSNTSQNYKMKIEHMVGVTNFGVLKESFLLKKLRAWSRRRTSRMTMSTLYSRRMAKCKA